MVVSLIISLILLTLSGFANGTCLLSTKTSNMSWVASIRKRINPDANKIICIGLIISRDAIVIPSKCLTQKAKDEYYTGTELKAVTGLDGHCTQTRDGVNYQSLVLSGQGTRGLSPTLLRYVAKLQVQPFEMEKDYEPSKTLIRLLPNNEEQLREFVDSWQGRDVACKVPVFGEDDGLSNKADLEQLVPIGKKRCEELLCQGSDLQAKGRPKKKSCLDVLWSADTYSCFTFFDQEKTCVDFNMGAPIICENKVCGLLKRCDPHGIVIMQLFTVEHFNAVGEILVEPMIASSKCIAGAGLLWTLGLHISFTTVFTSMAHHWV